MKNNLFRKFLAVFLTGTMLAGVGCKDYDDDIDKINDRLDGITSGNLATLDEQVKAMQSSIASLESAYKAADEALRKELDAQKAALATAKTSIEKAISDLSSKQASDIASVRSEISKTAADLTKLSQTVEKYNSDLAKKIQEVADNLKNNYYTKAETYAKSEVYTKAEVEALIDALRKEIKSDLTLLETNLKGEIAKNATAISKLQESLVGLTEQIDGMKTQVSEMQTALNGKVDNATYAAFTQQTNEKLGSVSEALQVLQALCAGDFGDETIKGYIDSADAQIQQSIADVSTKIDESIAEVKKMLGDYLKTTVFEKFLSEEFNALKTSVESRLDGLKTNIEDIEGRIDALDGQNGAISAMQKDLDELTQTIEGLKGSASQEALENLKTSVNNLEQTLATAKSDLKSAIDTKTTLAAVEATYTTENLKFRTGVNEVIEEALEEALNENGAIKIAIGTISTEFGTKLTDLSTNLTQQISSLQNEVKALIDALTGRVDALEDRIQSIVFVPDYLDGYIHFETAATITMLDAKGKEENVSLGNQHGKASTSIKFLVTPAKTAKMIKDAFKTNNQIASIEVKKVTRAAYNDAKFTISDIKASAEGVLTVEASTDYEFGSENGKTLAIALHVQIANPNGKKAEGEEVAVNQGIDFTTAFIGCYYDEENRVISAKDFVVARPAEGGKYEEYPSELNDDLLYTETGKEITFFEGYGIYYKKGETYTALDQLWNGNLKASLPNPGESIATSAKYTDEKEAVKHYDLTGTKMSIKDPSTTDLIGDVISSPEGTFALVNGEKNEYHLDVLANVRHKVSIKTVDTDIAAEGASFAWVYQQGKYTVKARLLMKDGKNVLTAKEYKDLQNLANLDGEPVATIAETGKTEATENATVESINLSTNPTQDSDSQEITVELRDMKLFKGGDYTIQVVYTRKDKTTVTIEIPVEVTGIPAISQQKTLSADITLADGKTEYALEGGANYGNLFWNDNLKDAFGTKERFATAFEAAKTTFKPVDNVGITMKAAPGETGKDLYVFLGNAENRAYELSGTIESEWYTEEIALKANVTIKYPTATLKEGVAYLAKTKTKTTIDGKTLSIMADLSNFYYVAETIPGIALKAVVTGGDVKDAAKLVTVKNVTLDWGEYTGKSVTAAIVVMLNGKEIARSADVTVELSDPANLTIEVEEGALNFEEGGNLNLYSLLTLNVVDANGELKSNAFTKTGLDADIAAALGVKAAEVKFTLANGYSLIEGVTETNGVVSAAQIANATKEITLKYNIVYKYTFGERPATVTVKITPQKPEIVPPAPEE